MEARAAALHGLLSRMDALRKENPGMAKEPKKPTEEAIRADLPDDVNLRGDDYGWKPQHAPSRRGGTLRTKPPERALSHSPQ